MLKHEHAERKAAESQHQRLCATRFVGAPYRRGAGADSSPSKGFDCSGFVCYSINAAGVSFPHNPTSSMASSPSVRVLKPNEAITPGNLMLFSKHVGFYDPGRSSHGDLLSAGDKGVRYGEASWYGNQYKSLKVMVKCK